MEAEFIAWLQQRLPRQPHLELGLGDDAAIVRAAGTDPRRVVSVDLLTDGVDFVLSQVDARRVGRKALAVNLSDLAAMAASPLAAVVALALPRNGALGLAQELYEGLIPLAEQYHIAIAGGDTNCWDGPLVISVTVIGEVPPSGSLPRSGARPGDSILVTGRFGGSRLGHQFDFEPRIVEALWLAERYPLHAGIDCSDGLSLDLSRLAAASGCGVLLELARVPIAPAAKIWAAQCNDGRTALDHALGDGEDFELILALPADAAQELVARQPLSCGLTVIGQCIAERGLWQATGPGQRRPLTPRGFEHH
jgi:thiamine-monophosphate kinase